MKEKIVKHAAGILASILLFGTASAGAEYMDVSGWSAKAIQDISARGIMVGVAKDSFAPYAKLTQCELASVLYRMAGKPSYTKLDYEYTDMTDPNVWYYDAALWAGYNQIIMCGDLYRETEDPSDAFIYSSSIDPQCIITRENALYSLYRLAVYKGYDRPVGDRASEFKEYDEWIFLGGLEKCIEMWNWGLETNIVYGYGDKSLRPTQDITREEFAAMVSRFMKYYDM